MFPASLPAGVTSRRLSSNLFTLEFSSSLPRPMTITSLLPLSLKCGKAGYRVTMPVKTGMTAVGFMSEPLASHVPYLTPSHGMTEGYVSMGGAGFVYPASRATNCRYREGESLEIMMDWSTRVVCFRTSNSEGQLQEARVAWPYGDSCFLAISSEGGPVTAEIQVL